jgi:hypothetical protein
MPLGLLGAPVLFILPRIAWWCACLPNPVLKIRFEWPKENKGWECVNVNIGLR